MSYPDAIKIPFNDSDLVLVGTIISKDEISKNQTKYGIDVEGYLKNSKSFDMISATSYEIKNQTAPYTEVHYYNEPFFDVGQKVFVYLKMNQNGEYIMSPYSFALEKNEAKGPPQSVIWITGPAKYQFNQGEGIVISGLVKKAYMYDAVQRGQDASINLKIFDKNNELLVSEKLNPKVDGTFEYHFQIIGEPRIPGKYSYEIQFGSDTMNGEFIIEVNPNLWTPLKQFKDGIDPRMIHCNDKLVLIQKYDGTPACVKEQSVIPLMIREWAKISEFEISHGFLDHRIVNATVVSMHFTVDYCSPSIIVQINSESKGTLTISVPRIFVNPTEGQEDDDFVVIVDGKEVDFEELSKDSKQRTLEIPFSNDSKNIEIIKTCLI
ncbi:MAG: hypothetical protein ACREAK_01190 [Nitrosarchaeum sp.]